MSDADDLADHPGVTQTGRWYDVVAGKAFVICDSDDLAVVQAWSLNCNGVINLETRPSLAMTNVEPCSRASGTCNHSPSTGRRWRRLLNPPCARRATQSDCNDRAASRFYFLISRPRNAGTGFDEGDLNRHGPWTSALSIRTVINRQLFDRRTCHRTRFHSASHPKVPQNLVSVRALE